MGKLNEDYLDEILDKISKFGFSFLTKAERSFLEAYSKSDGETMTKICREQISRKFESIDSKFTFTLVDIEKMSEEGILYHGELRVPDLFIGNGKLIQGIMNGYIWSINGNNIPIFERDGYDVLEFCDGIEWEFDIFLDYVISTIKDEKTDFPF
jgi:hypothetical protein